MTATALNPATPTHTQALSIDMMTPNQACMTLAVDQARLLSLVNSGELAAYDLGGSIRLRSRDVAALAPRTVVAA